MATGLESTNLTGRTALVCGASQGIGRATATALASLGANVWALSRRRDVLDALVAELPGPGAHRAVVADMSDLDGLRAAVSAAVDAAGPAHILIHNTGGPPPGPVLEAAPQAFLDALTRHLLSAQTLVQALLPGMAAASYGRIVCVTSTSVRIPIPNLGVSNTTRGAMASWAKSVAQELPAGVTINNVMPGFIDTPRLRSLAARRAEAAGTDVDTALATMGATVPEGRVGTPQEIGEMIALLCTPAARYVRGQSLAVDGGRTRSI